MTTRVKNKPASAIIAKLMAPITDDLTDKEMVRLEVRAAREAKKRIERDFYHAFQRVQAAEHFWLYKLSMRLSLSSPDEQSTKESSNARALYEAEVVRFMNIPAPSKKALAWKVRYLKVGAREKEFTPIIQADKVRLTA